VITALQDTDDRRAFRAAAELCRFSVGKLAACATRRRLGGGFPPRHSNRKDESKGNNDRYQSKQLAINLWDLHYFLS
jgi:hypothetical protein